MEDHLDPRVITAEDLRNHIDTLYRGQLAGLSGESVASFRSGILRDWNLEDDSIQEHFRIQPPRWGQGRSTSTATFHQSRQEVDL